MYCRCGCRCNIHKCGCGCSDLGSNERTDVVSPGVAVGANVVEFVLWSWLCVRFHKCMCGCWIRVRVQYSTDVGRDYNMGEEEEVEEDVGV